jgi:hypothetical protein
LVLFSYIRFIEWEDDDGDDYGDEYDEEEDIDT